MEPTNQLQAAPNTKGPISTRIANHSHGDFLILSECSSFDQNKKSPLLIAPFGFSFSYPSKYKVLLWNTKALHLLSKHPGYKIWHLWDNYYAVAQQDLARKEGDMAVYIYLLTSRGMKKVKRVILHANFITSNTSVIIGSKAFRFAYVIEQFWIRTLDKSFRVRYYWKAKEEVIKAFMCERWGILVTCSSRYIQVYPLDYMGKVEKQSIYEYALEHEFATACMDNDKLTVVTVYDGEQNTIVYVTKLQLTSLAYEKIEHNRQLTTLSNQKYQKYRFSFLADNKTILCKPSTIICIETGNILYRGLEDDKVLQYNHRERAVYMTGHNVIKKAIADPSVNYTEPSPKQNSFLNGLSIFIYVLYFILWFYVSLYPFIKTS